MLATKLRNSAAYPAKISATCATIQPLRNNWEVNSGGCCPMEAAKASKKTSGKTKIPKAVVRYLAQTARNVAMHKNANNDSEWCTVVGAIWPYSEVVSTKETR